VRPAPIHFVGVSADATIPGDDASCRSPRPLSADAIAGVSGSSNSLVSTVIRHEDADPKSGQDRRRAAFYPPHFDFRLTPSAAAHATVMDAQQRLAARAPRAYRIRASPLANRAPLLRVARITSCVSAMPERVLTTRIIKPGPPYNRRRGQRLEVAGARRGPRRHRLRHGHPDGPDPSA